MDTINNLESEVGSIVGASAAESYAAESPASVAIDVSEPLSVNPTIEAPSGSEVIYEAPAHRTDREGPGNRTLKHRMSAKDRAMARRKAREAKESMMTMDAEMTANLPNSNLPALPVVANTMGEDSSLSGNGVPEWYGSAETEMSQLMTSNALGQSGADYDHEIHYRADEMSAEDEAVLADYANWSEDSTILSGNGVPTYYGSAETFEAPMARHNPDRGDVNRVLASLRSRYSGLRVKGIPEYLTMRSGSSNKYHVFVRTNKGNFNGYGRIGYAPTIHGPMSDSEYDRKLRAKQRPNKGYEETKYAESAECGDCGRPATHSARGGTVNRCDRCWPGDDFFNAPTGYTPMSETPSPHEPYSFMDEMTPNGEFITSDEFMELMSETIDGMAMRYEKPSMFGSPLAMGVGGVLVAALGYKLWSKRSDTPE